MNYCDYCFQSQLCALCALLRDYSNYFLSYYYNDYLFPILLYALCFPQNIICIMSIMAIRIIRIMRIINIIAIIYVSLQIHESGLRLQNPGLTAGMHLYTSKAALAAKILRNPGSRCTSVWAGTPRNRRLVLSLTPSSHSSGTLQSRTFGRMFILPMHC